MVTLPKNCRVSYNSNGVKVRMVYSTELPQGVYNDVTVWESYPYVDKNGRQIKGKKYFALEFEVAYQNNLPMKVKDAYYEHKKKAMLFNRMKKVDMLKQEIDILSNSHYAGKWDIEHLRKENQLPNPPKQISLAF
jgi:hypothetical protein